MADISTKTVSDDMLFLNIIFGLIVLVLGRKLFWFFVAFSGFMVGVAFTEMMIPHFQQWLQIAVALGIGLMVALLAVLAQRMAFVLAGFLAGFYMMLLVTQSFGYDYVSAFFYVLGGAVGAAAGYMFIDWAIIGLSSLIGAGLIINEISAALPLPPVISVSFFLVLLVVGIAIQIHSMEDDLSGNK